MRSLAANRHVQLRLGGVGPGAASDPVVERLERRFDRLRASLVAEHAGKWALLLDRGARRVPDLEVHGDQWAAIDSGYQDPQHRRFCVKRIVSTDEPLIVRPSGV